MSPDEFAQMMAKRVYSQIPNTQTDQIETALRLRFLFMLPREAVIDIIIRRWPGGIATRSRELQHRETLAQTSTEDLVFFAARSCGQIRWVGEATRRHVVNWYMRRWIFGAIAVEVAVLILAWFAFR